MPLYGQSVDDTVSCYTFNTATSTTVPVHYFAETIETEIKSLDYADPITVAVSNGITGQSSTMTITYTPVLDVPSDAWIRITAPPANYLYVEDTNWDEAVHVITSSNCNTASTVEYNGGSVTVADWEYVEGTDWDESDLTAIYDTCYIQLGAGSDLTVGNDLTVEMTITNPGLIQNLIDNWTFAIMIMPSDGSDYNDLKVSEDC